MGASLGKGDMRKVQRGDTATGYRRFLCACLILSCLGI